MRVRLFLVCLQICFPRDLANIGDSGYYSLVRTTCLLFCFPLGTLHLKCELLSCYLFRVGSNEVMKHCVKHCQCKS